MGSKAVLGRRSGWGCKKIERMIWKEGRRMKYGQNIWKERIRRTIIIYSIETRMDIRRIE